MRRLLLPLLALVLTASASAQTDVPKTLMNKGMHELGAFEYLRELTTQVGGRIAGSPQAEKAVRWAEAKMRSLGFQNVRRVPCTVSHWVRGTVESCSMVSGSTRSKLTCCALGGSVGTGSKGVVGEVIEVHNVDEVAALGSRAKGKIVFFNGPMDATLENTFGAYGRAVRQRTSGAAAAAKVGAIGVLVRSMTMAVDDVPHTGVTNYDAGGRRIPAAALSLVAANRLSKALASKPSLKVRLALDCKNFPDVASSDVVGEILGSEMPKEVIVMGGHLDSWDKGKGAHDDGAGVVQSLEALRLIHDLGWKPKRTIRVVLFMDEEHSGGGAEGYATYQKKQNEKVVAALESDSGGFAPRGFGSSYTADEVAARADWVKALAYFGADHLTPNGGGGADVGPLKQQGAVLFGLQPESQRYFDYHHSDKDTLDKVNPRELELGALCMATLVWLLSEQS